MVERGGWRCGREGGSGEVVERRGLEVLSVCGDGFEAFDVPHNLILPVDKFFSKAERIDKLFVAVAAVAAVAAVFLLQDTEAICLVQSHTGILYPPTPLPQLEHTVSIPLCAVVVVCVCVCVCYSSRMKVCT